MDRVHRCGRRDADHGGDVRHRAGSPRRCHPPTVSIEAPATRAARRGDAAHDTHSRARELRARDQHERDCRDPRRRRRATDRIGRQGDDRARRAQRRIPWRPVRAGPSIDHDQRGRGPVSAGGRRRAGRIFRCAPARCSPSATCCSRCCLPSADNIAETLAVWVSGNRSAFIARLNATAAAMGMHHTHFADPSGISVQNGLDRRRISWCSPGGHRQSGARRAWCGTAQRGAARRHRPAQPRHPARASSRLARHQDRVDRSRRRMPALRRPR